MPITVLANRRECVRAVDQWHISRRKCGIGVENSIARVDRGIGSVHLFDLNVAKKEDAAAIKPKITPTGLFVPTFPI